jgi:hypothetical protein
VISDDDLNVSLGNRFSPLGASTPVTSGSSLGYGVHIVQLLEPKLWGVARRHLTSGILFEQLDEVSDEAHYPLAAVCWIEANMSSGE